MPQPRASTSVSQVGSLLARAAQLLRAGRPGDAVVPFREAARLQPDNSAVLHDLGVACLESGLIPEAITALQRAVVASPRFAKAFWRLGIALEMLGNEADAIETYRRATALLPSLTEAHFRAGNLLEISGHAAEAIASFRRAATSGPKTSLGRIGAARALIAQQRNSEAEQALRRAVAVEPANAMADELLGTVLADAGQFEEAAVCYQRAIHKAPGLAGSYYDLVRCRRITSADEDLIGRMQAALAEPKLDANQRMRVHLALGKAAEDLSDYRLAMQHFDSAYTLRRALSGFDPSGFAEQAKRVMARCTRDILAQASSLGSDAATPVLILGMPRSGTTLLEQIVSSHPSVSAGGELHFWNQRGFAWLQAGASGSDPPFLAGVAADYRDVLRAAAPAAARITDKMPMNFLWAGLIHLVFPHATLIHCRRTPIDTALSIHQTYFNARLELPTGGDELVAYYRTYEQVVEHWRRVLPADRFIEVDYEELTAEPEPVIRRIVAGCGLPWDDACLRPERNVRVVNTASKWQARQPIYQSAVGRWRHYEPWLGPLRALLPEGSSN